MNTAEEIKKLNDYDAIERQCLVCAESTKDLDEQARIWNFADRSALKQSWDSYEVIEADFSETIENDPGDLSYLEALQRAEALGFNKMLDLEIGNYSLAEVIRYAIDAEIRHEDTGYCYSITRSGYLLKSKVRQAEFVYDILLAVEEAGFSLAEVDKALQARRASVKSEAKAAAARENGKKGGRPRQMQND